jgi:hypothetical protein
MTARLTFRPATDYEPGAIYAILTECYADLMDGAFRDRLRQFDHRVFAAPDTVGARAIISSIGDEKVGLLSHGPPQDPEVGVIGQNGVRPIFQNRGYGTQQIQEILFRPGPQNVREVRLPPMRDNARRQVGTLRHDALREVTRWVRQIFSHFPRFLPIF